MSMKIELRVGETLSFEGSGKATITLMEKSGQRARLDIQADDSVKMSKNTPVSGAAMARNGLSVHPM
jgi:hypothetical protein